MAMRAREFKVIGRARQAEHHTVEPIVIREAVQLGETKSVAIKPRDGFEVVGRPRDAQLCRLLHAHGTAE